MSNETRENCREEQAKREIGTTEISRSQARFLAAVFVLAIVIVPVCQHVIGWREKRVEGSAPSLIFYKSFDGVGAEMADDWREAPTPLRRFLNSNATLLKRINASQEAMDDTCFLTKALVAPVQAALCHLGAGNEKGFVGRDGWLFYEPGIRYLTGPGFLAAEQLARRARAGNEYLAPPQPDPVSAIVHFHDQLRERGIKLILLPVPVKAGILPGKFSGRYEDSGAALQNKSYPEFLARLGAAGVQVFDPAPILVGMRDRGEDVYLKTDTHWRPEAMQAVASALAADIPDPALRLAQSLIRVPCAVTNLGDIAVMLKLPLDQSLYAPEVVTIQRVLDATGTPWQPSAAADVLLLGDSFANIYSLGDMGWGESAGLAEQLSASLGAPVDRIIRNDAGAFATREMLARALARGQDRLAGKRVVVWEFSTRELAVGDWKTINLVLDEAKVHQPHEKPSASCAGVLVTGMVDDVSERPEKGAVYKDFVMKLYVTGLTSADGAVYGEGDGVVHVLAMRAREILPVAAVQVGVKLALRIRPWEDVEPRYGTMKAGSLDDVMLEIDKTLYWGELQ